MDRDSTTVLPWGESVALYQAWLRTSCRPGTVKMRTYHIRRFAAAVAKPPLEVTLDDLLEHLGCDTWSAGTRRSVRSSLKSFYTWARHTRRLLDDPTEYLPTIPVPPGRPRPASEDAVDEGLHAKDARVRVMVELAARSGLRCCEVAVVRGADVTSANGRHRLRVLGKGGKVRVVPLSAQLAHRLRENGDGYVFEGRIDGHLSAAYVSKLVSRAMQSATAHQLRHRFGSRAFNKGGKNIRAVQELLGHASVATTQIYTQVDDDELWAAHSAAA